jgi:hypothetical protein
VQPLNPDQLDAVLRRFHHARDGKLRSVDVALVRGRVAAVTYTIAVRDADRADALCDLRLQVTDVAEVRFQVRPTEDPQTLADGIRIETFHGLIFVDLLPWTDRPSGAHDYRVSSCYAAGVALRWEVADG